MQAHVVPTQEIATGVGITAILQTVPKVTRPDEVEEHYTSRGLVPPEKTLKSIVGTLLIISTAAFIFVTIVAWFSFILAWLHQIVAGASGSVTLAQFYYAIIATSITIIELTLFFFLYYGLKVY